MKIKNLTAHIAPACLPPFKWRADSVAAPHGKSSMGVMNFLNKHSGFTLIEVIVTLVMVSILATMMYSYFGSSITQSSMPLVRMGNALQLQKATENISASYRSLYNTSTYEYDLGTLKTNIGGEGTPQDNSYGQYEVIDNHYTKINLSTRTEESPGTTQNLLKVTVKSTVSGETLTLLFSRQ